MDGLMYIDSLIFCHAKQWLTVPRFYPLTPCLCSPLLHHLKGWQNSRVFYTSHCCYLYIWITQKVFRFFSKSPIDSQSSSLVFEQSSWGTQFHLFLHCIYGVRIFHFGSESFAYFHVCFTLLFIFLIPTWCIMCSNL